MRQHPDDFHDQDLDPYGGDNDDLEELGTSVYQGTGLSVRALTAEELQRFLDAHHDQPAELLGSGWATLDPSGQPLGASWTPPAATPPAPAGPPSGSRGSPGRSALAAYRRRRSEELAGWARTLVWRAPLVAAAGLTGQVLATRSACRGPGWSAWWPLRWWAGGCGFGPPSRPAAGGAAPKGSGTPPACWTGSPVTAMWCSTTWRCPARSRTSTTW